MLLKLFSLVILIPISFYGLTWWVAIYQSSSLWMRVLLVVFTVVLVYELLRFIVLWGLVGLLTLIIFVGGLLVILVRVSTISFQEQGMVFSGLLAVGVLFVFLGGFRHDPIFLRVEIIGWLGIAPFWVVGVLVLLVQGFARLA